MPVVIKSQGNDSTQDLIRRFKKAVANANVVQQARDGQYFVKDSQKRATKKIEKNRLRKRARKLKKAKNISPNAIQRINERLSTQ